MQSSTWSIERSTIVAEAINRHADIICGRVSNRLAEKFPNLCYDPARLDAATFQQATFRDTPRRFHRLLQGALLCDSVAIIEREYTWGSKILIRYQVERHHMLAQVRWYFEEVFATAQLTAEDKSQLIAIRDDVSNMIEKLMPNVPPTSEVSPPQTYRNGSNGHGPHHNS